MKNYNSEFFDEFKRLDKLCREIYGRSADNKLGVTLYLEDMASKTSTGVTLVPNWKSDYNRLRHLRSVRNELAHSPDTFSQAMCSLDDVEFIRSFYSRITSRTDPLSLYEKKHQRISPTTRSKNNTTRARHVKKTAPREENRGCLWEVIAFFTDLL